VITKLRDTFKNGEKASQSIAGAAFLIAAMGLASRVLGLFRDRILAGKFGAGDAFIMPLLRFQI